MRIASDLHGTLNIPDRTLLWQLQQRSSQPASQNSKQATCNFFKQCALIYST